MDVLWKILDTSRALLKVLEWFLVVSNNVGISSDVYFDELRFIVGSIGFKVVRFLIGSGFGSGKSESCTKSAFPSKFIPRYAMAITTKI